MKIKIVLISLFILLSFLQMAIIRAEDIKVNDYISISGIEETLEIRNLGREISYNSHYHDLVINYFYLFNRINQDLEKLAKDKFVELNLHNKGLPILNLLIMYENKNKQVNIIYGDGCIYDKEILDNLAKKASEEMKNSSSSYAPLVELAKVLSKISSIEFQKIKNNPILYCPIAQTKEYKVKEIIEDTNCKPFFEGDKFNSSRLKILVLGKNFSTQEEFKFAINQYVLKEGFQKIEPFKSYAKNGKDGLFYFVYGDYNLKGDLQSKSVFDEIFIQNLTYEISKCPDVFYTIFIYNGKSSKDFRGYYDTKLKTSFNTLVSSTIMHETGHRFQLSDEYTGVFAAAPAIHSALGYFQLSCSKNPEIDWKDIFNNLDNYQFRTCSGDEDNYRSSFQSIMRHSGIYTKFNFLSCLFLVREFEREDIINDKIKDICLKMYNSNELQKQEEISDDDIDYINCLNYKEGHKKEVDCKKILIDCAKKETDLYDLEVCFMGEVNKILNEP